MTGYSFRFLLFFFSGETLVNVLDCKKDMGLWHGVLTVSLNNTCCISRSVNFFVFDS